MARYVREIVKAIINVANRKPPANVEAEQAVLSALMTGNKQAMREVRETGLTPAHFHFRANQEIAKVAWALDAKSEPVDVQTIAELLRKQELNHERDNPASADRDTTMLDVVGGVAYLARIVDATPAVAHVSAHARIVLEKARVRGVIEAVEIIAGQAYSDYGDAREFFTDARRRLGEAIETGDGAMRGLVSARDAVASLHAKLKAAWAGEKEAFGLPLPWRRMNFVLGGLELGTLTFLAAFEGEGKSVAANQIYMHVAGRMYDGHPCGVFVWNGEMPTVQVIQRGVLLEANRGTSCRTEGQRVRLLSKEMKSGHEYSLEGEELGPLDAFKITALDAASVTVASKPIEYEDTTGIDLATLTFLVRSAKERLAEKKCASCRDKADQSERPCTCVVLRLVVIDHFHLLGHRADAYQSTNTEAVQESCKVLKSIAKAEGVAIIALCQYLSSVAREHDGPPTNGMIIGGAAIKQIADNIIHVRRPWERLADKQTLDAAKIRHDAEMHVTKARDSKKGVFQFWFEDDAIRFDEKTEV